MGTTTRGGPGIDPRDRGDVRRGRRATIVIAIVAAGCVAARPAPADGQQWDWPERAEDLRELPADFPGDRLSAVMRGFTNALGVRCSYCHVGTEGEPLASYDFVSNANPNKDRARAMLRLLGDVNTHLREIEPSGERVNMWCHTCHAGKPKPQTLAEALAERHGTEGGEAVVTYYRELRERFYGAGSYDFRPASVSEAAAAILERGDTATAIRLQEAGVEDAPDAAAAHEALGDLLRIGGDDDGARAAYRRALELAPDAAAIRAKLRELGGA